MNLRNKFRNLIGIRTKRELPAPGPMPQIGSSIVFDKYRIRLKYPIGAAQWNWFTQHGWREVGMRTNRRRYVCVPDNFLVKLLDASESERDVLQQKLIEAGASTVCATSDQ